MDIIRSSKKNKISFNQMVRFHWPSILGITSTYINIYTYTRNQILHSRHIRWNFYGLFKTNWLTIIIQFVFSVGKSKILSFLRRKKKEVANQLVLYEAMLSKRQHTLIYMMTSISNIKKSKKKKLGKLLLLYRPEVRQ